MTEMNEQQIPVEPNDDFDVENEIEPYEHIKERKVVIQPYDYAVRTLVDMIIEGDLILEPDYQRKYQWDDVKASRFIESIALNIPVPVVYLAEEKDGTFSVIDGQQRLTSLFRFIKATEIENLFPDSGLTPLKLSGLKIISEINGKEYLQLDRVLRSNIAKRAIRCIVVLNESDEALKFEVFERLNTGSASLSDQEVRNCVYRGSYNELLKDLARYKKFEDLISLPEQDAKSMKAVELVLRFMAYRELTSTSDYSDNYSEYLNLHMEDNREISSSRAEYIKTLFYGTVDLIYNELGPGTAFRKPKNQVDPKEGFFQNRINGSIYESQMVAFSRAFENGWRDKLADKAFSVFQNDGYWKNLFQGTSKKNSALSRSTILTEALMG
ncbi:DUF262 domain-containing protein [Jejubacter calystegiae]|uniref:DUF262 domain-containing protein n=1 Tax=Jejubacter calystegiae TaxID=2579935 RepID=A0A4P8YDH3_9ENTR|nr:DUF262 domain-containing protein [Jejubacter calystegiae]QCT18539.1 DUF262 domain-containing protein [Jejubacter calystegiae]